MSDEQRARWLAEIEKRSRVVDSVISKTGERTSLVYEISANQVEDLCAAITALVTALQEARGEVDRLTDDNEELRSAPWPEWATKVIATIRAHSGYDGSDDTIDGIDMPQELGEILDEYQGQIERQAAELATLRAENERLNSSVEYLGGIEDAFETQKSRLEHIESVLENPEAVWVDMLNGKIATPSHIAKQAAEILTLRAEVERLRGENSRLIKSNTGESYQAGPITKAVMAYVRANPKFTTNEILVELQLPNKAVSNALAHCVRRGVLNRTGYGRYETPPETTK